MPSNYINITFKLKKMFVDEIISRKVGQGNKKIEKKEDFFKKLNEDKKKITKKDIYELLVLNY